MLKRSYKAKNGTTFYTLEFVYEDERDLAERRLEVWSEKILELLTIGHELILNGRSLERYKEIDREAEMRQRVGHKLLEWGQLLLMRNEDEELIKGLGRLVREMQHKREEMEDDG